MDDGQDDGQPDGLDDAQAAPAEASLPDRIDALIPGPVRHVCRRLGEHGHEAYAVGGAVRDALLGRDPGDWDVATSATPEQVIALFARTIPTGLQHGTVTVMVRDHDLAGNRDGDRDRDRGDDRGGDRQPDTRGRAGERGRAGPPPARMAIEVTTFRGDGAYTDGRRPDSVTFGVPLREDLARRDFVINAMAYDPVARRIADPFGGAADLAARRVRAVGDPAARFGEDGLRVMRAIRFAAALGFDLDPDTEAAIPGALPVLARVSAERVRDELLKTLRAPVLARGPSRGLAIARRTGVLAQILPGLAFVPTSGDTGGDTGGDTATDEHTRWRRALARVDAATAPDSNSDSDSDSDPALIRLAALLLELRPSSPPEGAARADAKAAPADPTRGDPAQAAAADAVCVALKLSGAERERVVSAVAHGRAWADAPASDRDLRAVLGAITRVRVPDSIALWRAERAAADAVGAHADARAAADLADRAADILRRGDALAVADLAITGGDAIRLLGIRPGPIVGVLLRALLSRVLADPALNDRDRLAALLPDLHAELAR